MKIPRSWIFATLTGGAIGLASSAFAHYFRPNEFSNYYSEVRSDLFNAAFIIAGFLMTMKTYIVVKMEETIYTKETYITNFALAKLDGETSDKCQIDPLRRLAGSIQFAIGVSAVAALLQLLEGTIRGPVESFLGVTAFGCAIGSGDVPEIVKTG